MTTIDRNDAPDGYEAVKPHVHELCDGCCFWGEGCFDIGAGCTPSHRKDGQHVIFKRLPVTSAPATLLHPMGSLGEDAA